MSSLSKEEAFRKAIRELIEKELDELTSTGAIDGFGTPFAFQGDSKANKKHRKDSAESVDGFEVIGDLEERLQEAVERKPGFEQRANQFLKKVQDKLNKHYRKSYPDFRGNDTTLEVMKGSKFWRIVATSEGRRSVWAFLDTRTGDILKPAGWKAPAKGPRGNIFDSDYGIKGLTPYGPEYKRGPNYAWKESIKEAGDPYYAWRDDDSKTDRMRIGEAIREMNHQLREVEKTLRRCRRLKKESGMNPGDYWKRTNAALVKMEARMHNIAKTVREMRG